MTVHRYRTGLAPTWVGPSGILMVEQGREAMVRQLALDTLTVAIVIDALVAEGWAAMPDFACMTIDADGVNVLLRGAFVVTTAGGERIDGSGVRTWTERRLQEGDASSIRLEHAVAADGGIELPVSDAVVLASSVTVGAGREPAGPAETAAALVGPEPMPQAIPEPTVETEVEVPSLSPTPVPSMSPPPVMDAAATIVEPDDHVFDAMFGATVPGRRPEDAAVREPDEASVAAATAPPALIDAVPAGDHDGRTMTRQQLAALRSQAAPKPVSQVSGVVLELTDGQRVEVERTALVGRNPRALQASGAELPTLVIVDDPYVSSTHVELRVDGVVVTVTDVSTNGTTSTSPDGHVEQLVSGQATPVVSGTVLRLSDDVSVTIHVETPS